ncbi:ABC transporter ATP-binding protein [candidate division WOR-3 bacterium]|uniref:ABC transporter ATP-binding protein n=1 Tax=candidate division WOR-3 bacterium TaxID=2052148 RepID=A0A938BSB1_UNCW3|nr:ABC transporter ATP-binding protein [candidate division WOR-3 bacterium]
MSEQKQWSSGPVNQCSAGSSALDHSTTAPLDHTPVLQATDVWRVFETGTERLEILRGVDLEVQRGDLVAILGPSGTGKSTLLHVLGALDRPTRGRVLLDSLDVFSYPESELHEVRNRKLGFVFQFHHLLSEFTVLENVAMPLLVAGVARAEALVRAHKVLEEIGFTSRLTHRPAELSGGEQARAAMGRALVNDPAVILADEPTGNLDTTSAAALVDLMVRLSNERKMTILVVTHNQAVADRATRRLHLAAGKLDEESNH